MSKTATTPNQDAPPADGGRWWRLPDGSLSRRPPEPAAPPAKSGKGAPDKKTTPDPDPIE